MKKLLLTGFEGFLNFKVNPTEEIVNKLDGTVIGGFEISGRVLSVQFHHSSKELIQHAEELHPDVILSLGLAAGRNRITPERIAINCMDGPEDNKGYRPEDERIVSEGPDAYFSTLPIRKFVQALNHHHFPAEVSNSAGTYLCNHVMYSMLHHIHTNNSQAKAGFVHIPASHELAKDHSSLPSWGQNDLLKAVEVLIGELDEK